MLYVAYTICVLTESNKSPLQVRKALSGSRADSECSLYVGNLFDSIKINVVLY